MEMTLEEIIHLDKSIKLVYGFPGKLGLKSSFRLTDGGSSELQHVQGSKSLKSSFSMSTFPDHLSVCALQLSIKY